MSKSDRDAMVEALSQRFQASPTLFLTDFTGLTVGRMTEFRRRLRAAGANYLVAKNTLAQRALAANRIAGLEAHLAGPTGFVLAGSDPLAAAKVLTDFVREFEQKPGIRAGYLDGAAVDAAYVKRLGSLPPREVLLGQMAGGLNAILYQFAAVVDALREQRSPAA